jgi:hypothetical protein
MQKNTTIKDAGLKRVLQRARKVFRIPENTEYYSVEDYKLAEKKYIKYCVLEGRCIRADNNRDADH